MESEWHRLVMASCICRWQRRSPTSFSWFGCYTPDNIASLHSWEGTATIWIGWNEQTLVLEMLRADANSRIAVKDQFWLLASSCTKLWQKPQLKLSPTPFMNGISTREQQCTNSTEYSRGSECSIILINKWIRACSPLEQCDVDTRKSTHNTILLKVSFRITPLGCWLLVDLCSMKSSSIISIVYALYGKACDNCCLDSPAESF